MLKLLAIGAGGFIGATCRFGLTHFVHRLTGFAFPWGTLVVNVVGCLALGVVAGLVERDALVSEPLRALIAVGVLGSFTTFSTFGLETLALVESSHWRAGVLHVVGSLLLGGVALLAGRAIVRLAA